MNQDLLISLEEGKMMPVYSLSNHSLFIGKDCRGCTDDRAGRRNDTHNKTNKKYDHAQETRTPYKTQVCSGSRRMGTYSCDTNVVYYPPNEGDFFNDRNLWKDVCLANPNHRTITKQIIFIIKKKPNRLHMYYPVYKPSQIVLNHQNGGVLKASQH